MSTPSPKEGTVKELDRWTTASSNCLGYAPDDGELVKFEDAMEVIQGIETERNNALHREHEASEQMRVCHEILDRLGAPRNQDNGLSYHLNGRLSRLTRNETGQLWEAEIRKREHLLLRCRSELRSVLADINAEQVPHDGDDFHELLRDLDAVLDPTK